MQLKKSKSFDLRRIAAALALGLLAFGCGGRIEEKVEYDVYRMPIAGFRKLTFLGLAKAKDVDKSHLNYLQSAIAKCQQYEKVSRLEHVFKLADDEKASTVKKLRGDLAAFQDARYVHGVLVIEPIKRETSRTSEPVMHVQVAESMDHGWFDSYGYFADPRVAMFGVEEIGPRVKHSQKKVTQRNTKIEIGLRYVLYNKNLDQIIFDRRSFASASISTYSGKPAITDKGVSFALYRSLMARIARAACPKIASVERSLLAAGSDSKADALVQKGIELADDDNWEAAADQWKKAVLIDKKNHFAYHDLGVYYERAGNAPAAMEEFGKAKKFGGKGFSPKQYDDSLAIFRPHVEPGGLEPLVYAMSGANWASIYGGKKQDLVVGKEYQVYRIRRLGEAPDYRFDGVSVTEAGRIRIVKHEPPFTLARVTQFLGDVRVERGDVVITGGAN